MTTYQINIAFRGEHWGLIMLPHGVDETTARIRYDVTATGFASEGFEVILYRVRPAIREDISSNGHSAF